MLIHVIIHMCTIVHVNILNVIQSIDWKRLESAVMLESPINNWNIHLCNVYKE